MIYESNSGKNILVQSSVFLCVDKLEPFKYMINVVDQS